MKTSRLACRRAAHIAVGLLAVVCDLSSAGAGEPLTPLHTQLSYSAPGLKLLGSTAPIPAQHVRCVQIMEARFERDFQRINRRKAHDHNWDALIRQTNKMTQRIDWGIDGKTDYPVFAGGLRRSLPELRARLEQAEAELQKSEQELKRHIGERSSSPAVDAAIAALRFSAYNDSFDVVLFLEGAVDNADSFARFAECIIANGLSPTINQSP